MYFSSSAQVEQVLGSGWYFCMQTSLIDRTTEVVATIIITFVHTLIFLIYRKVSNPGQKYLDALTLLP